MRRRTKGRDPGAKGGPGFQGLLLGRAQGRGMSALEGEKEGSNRMEQCRLEAVCRVLG